MNALSADQSGLAEAIRAINNLATAQGKKDAPRPKEFSGKEEDFQLWSKKTEGFFAGGSKESDVMLEWSAEEVTELTHENIELEFTPTVERGVLNLVFVLQQVHTAHMALTSNAANDIVANSRKNPLDAWRRLQGNPTCLATRKTEAFFAGVIKESETMWDWAAEQATEIAAELINREFLKTATNQEGGVHNLEFVLQQVHTALMALAS